MSLAQNWWHGGAERDVDAKASRLASHLKDEFGVEFIVGVGQDEVKSPILVVYAQKSARIRICDALPDRYEFIPVRFVWLDPIRTI